MSDTTRKWTKLLTSAIKFLPEAGWVGIVVELLSQLASSMGATSGDSKEALKHIESLRGDLMQVTAAHTSLAQQLEAQTSTLALHTEKLDALSTELHLTKLSTKAIELRLTTLESRSSRSFYAVIALCILTTLTLALLATILMHQTH